jgi:energy-coupling factor transporter ATP-binding protein EcfA2
MLQRVVIRNYRSCHYTSFDCHPQLSVFIGPNSSGKTNILQAIMLLYKIAQEEDYHRLHPDSERVNVTSNIGATFVTKKKSTVQLRAYIDAFTDDSNNDILVESRQKWVITNSKGQIEKSEIPLFFFARMGWHAVQSRYQMVTRKGRPFLLRSPRELPAAWTTDALEYVARYCSGIRYYSASQFTNPGTSPVSFEIEKEGPESRPLRLRGHAATLFRIYQLKADKKSDRFSQFMDIVGANGLRLVDNIDFKEINTAAVDVTVRVGGKIERRRRQKILIVPQFKKGREVLSPNQLSEGTFKTLALLFNIITDDSKALLIEEPEVCVHQGLLSSILELIKKYSERKQMFVSTHSDYVLDQVSPENVFTVRYDRKAGTKVHQIRKAMSSREFDSLRHYLQNEGNLGDFWREGGLEARNE